MAVKVNEKQRMFIFINLMVTGIATSMLATAMTTALPPVVEYFGISTTTGQWMTSGYSLVMGMVIPLSAFLIKKISTKKLYIFSIVCFIIGELVCIIAPGFGVLMIGRVLQAIGNGILTSMGQVIILSIYPKEKKGAMMVWAGGYGGTNHCADYCRCIGGHCWLEIYIYLYHDCYADFSGYVRG